MRQTFLKYLKHPHAAPPLRGGFGAGYLLAVLTVVACSFAGYHLRPLFSETDIIMLFLVGAVAAASMLGRGPALLYSLLSVSAFNYFFVEPIFTFNVYNPSYWLTFAVMFFACLVISTLAARLRDQVFQSRRREREALMLYELMKELAVSGARDDMSKSFVRWIAEAMGADVRIRYPDGTVFGGATSGDAAGLATEAGGHTPRDWNIRNADRALGVVTLPARPLLPDQELLMETSVGLLGSALARAETAQAAELAKILTEKEKMRNILLSSVSHDLRSPLAAITGAADVLLQARDRSGADGDRLLTSVRQEAARLAKIVNNLLDITRIEGGHLKLNMKSYDPAEIIGSAVETCRPALKDHSLALKVAPELPFVRMDGLLISQVLQNLLENVSRHTPAGTKVTIFAVVEDGALCLRVEDNGPGIPRGEEKNIFNKFSTDSRGDRPKGTGLGLAICQAIMLAHQGSIGAENLPGGGCRMTVRFPASLTLPASLSGNSEA